MIVVADTSVVLNLCRVGQVELLRRLFGVVMIPPEVEAEFQRLTRNDPRFAGLAVPDWLEIRAASPAVRLEVSTEDLDAGEVAALALGLEWKVDAILLDEAAAREVARALGLRTIGILGTLLQAKEAGLILAVAPILEDLLAKASFWVAEPLKAEVLRLAGESSSRRG